MNPTACVCFSCDDYLIIGEYASIPYWILDGPFFFNGGPKKNSPKEKFTSHMSSFLAA